MTTRLRKALAVTIGLGVPAAAAYFLLIVRGPPGTVSPRQTCSALAPVLTEPVIGDPVAVPIHEPVELDFQTRAQVLALRRDRVGERPGELARLGCAAYEPSPLVFGRIEDGRPWWGLVGIAYYGAGARSNEGASEESRFLGNPFLLVGLQEAFSQIASTPAEIYPEPTEIVWDASLRVGRVRYALTDYFAKSVWYRTQPPGERVLVLVAYNARDFELPWFAMDAARSERAAIPTDAPHPIPQFIHTGPSCGQDGGCNNMSPHDTALEVRVGELPAKLVLRLWRKEPKGPANPPSMWWTLEMR